MERSEEHPTTQPSSAYTLNAQPYHKEDILFCIDTDPETKSKMRPSPKTSHPITRLESIKQAVTMFVHAKLSIDPGHRFSFCTLAEDLTWDRPTFTSRISDAFSALSKITPSDSSHGPLDLTGLFRRAADEAKRSRQRGRILRVVLVYSRSGTVPWHRFPSTEGRSFTLDVVYVRDREGAGNCPQKVFDALVDAVEHVSELEGYVLETGQRLNHVVARLVLTLLCHPDQRGVQDDDEIGVPGSLARPRRV